MEENKKIMKRSFSRFFAVQILFSYFSEEAENRNLYALKEFIEKYYISEEFSLDDKEEYKKNIDLDFLNELLLGVVNNNSSIDEILTKELDGKYTIETVDKLIKIILKLAIFEFCWIKLDRKIVINEYVDIASEYFDKKAVSYVNAILDKISKNIKEENV